MISVQCASNLMIHLSFDATCQHVKIMCPIQAILILLLLLLWILLLIIGIMMVVVVIVMGEAYAIAALKELRVQCMELVVANDGWGEIGAKLVEKVLKIRVHTFD